MPHQKFQFGQRSLDTLKGVHPSLVMVAKRAISISPVDFMVTCGVRTQAEQDALYAQGRTKPGPKVTWTRNSRHLVNPKTGFGHAIDVVPWPIDWNDTGKFDKIALAMFSAASYLHVPIRWGANWDGDGNWREKGEHDSPHFELSL